MTILYGATQGVNAIKAEAPLYYIKRGDAFLNWSGHLFTREEECAWLGTAEHLSAFRPRHSLASAKGVKIITAPSEINPIPVHEEQA